MDQTFGEPELKEKFIRDRIVRGGAGEESDAGVDVRVYVVAPKEGEGAEFEVSGGQGGWRSGRGEGGGEGGC